MSSSSEVGDDVYIGVMRWVGGMGGLGGFVEDQELSMILDEVD